jgi:hypothetical protein
MLCCRLVQPGTNSVATTKPLSLVKIGFLRLLSTWLDNCPTAVKVFLSSPNNLPFLVEIILASTPTPSESEGTVHVQGLCCLLLGLCFKYNEDDPSSQFNKSSLHTIITQRIGIDQFNSKLDALKKNEQFIKAEQGLADTNEALRMEDIGAYVKQFQQQPHIIYYYDYDFTLFYKATVDKIQKQLKSPKGFLATKSTPKEAIHSPPVSMSNAAPTKPVTTESTSSSNNEAVLVSYKELIRQQDRELDILKQRNKELESKLKEQGSTSSNSDQSSLPQIQVSLFCFLELTQLSIEFTATTFRKRKQIGSIRE